MEMSILKITETAQILSTCKPHRKKYTQGEVTPWIESNSVYYNWLRCTPALLLAIHDSGSERKVTGDRLVCHPKTVGIYVTPSSESELASGTPPWAISSWNRNKDKRISSHTKTLSIWHKYTPFNFLSDTQQRQSHTRSHNSGPRQTVSGSVSALITELIEA